MSNRLSQRVLPKTAAYTIIPPRDHAGTVFTNRGASGSVTITLPTPQRSLLGWWYDFRVHANQTLVVAAASAGQICTRGNAAADNVSFATASAKIGRTIRATCEGSGTTFQWFCEPLSGDDGFSVNGTAEALRVGGTALTATAAELNILSGVTATATEINKLAGVTAGTRTASKAVVLGSSSEINQWDVAQTITDATATTTRILRSVLTCTPATTQSIGSSGSLCGCRGEIVLTTGKTFVDGFWFGTQGKVTLNGTLAESAAGRITGVLGQVDLASGTLTLGQVSAVWGDLQGNPTLTVNDQLYVGRFTNSMSAGKKAQAFTLFYGAADFFMEASADGGTADWLTAAAVGGSQSHKLKVSIMGTTYYIPLNTA